MYLVIEAVSPRVPVAQLGFVVDIAWSPGPDDVVKSSGTFSFQPRINRFGFVPVQVFGCGFVFLRRSPHRFTIFVLCVGCLVGRGSSGIQWGISHLGGSFDLRVQFSRQEIPCLQNGCHARQVEHIYSSARRKRALKLRSKNYCLKGEFKFRWFFKGAFSSYFTG